MWLFLAATEVCTPLHAWLHGGTIPDNDDCAVAAIAHGKMQTVASAAPAVMRVIWTETGPRFETLVFRPATAFLPEGRGPPVFAFHS